MNKQLKLLTNKGAERLFDLLRNSSPQAFKETFKTLSKYDKTENMAECY